MQTHEPGLLAHLKIQTLPLRSAGQKVLRLPHQTTLAAALVSQNTAPPIHTAAHTDSSPGSEVPEFCKRHAKQAVFTCAPQKPDTLSSFRPGQPVTK